MWTSSASARSLTAACVLSRQLFLFRRRRADRSTPQIEDAETQEIVVNEMVSSVALNLPPTFAETGAPNCSPTSSFFSQLENPAGSRVLVNKIVSFKPFQLLLLLERSRSPYLD